MKPVNNISACRHSVRQFTPLWVVLGLWGGLVLLFAIQTKVTSAQTWSDVLAQVGSFWLPWIFLLPIVVWISLRCPFERSKILSHIGVHISICAATLTVNQLTSRFILPMSPAPFDSHGPPPPELRLGPDILIYLVTMSASVAFAHYRKSQERERRAIELEARLAQAKLQALRMQINPHFLFNTFNVISSLVHTNPRIADDMITDLSELFRVSFENSDNQEISLSRELELLRCYLAIEQRRFGERLQIEQDVDPKILDALVPTLILQPIAENAIRHGIEPQAAVGKIAIRVLRDDNKIKISVSDNGKKPVVFPLTENESGRRGVGLANTRARLQQLYGKEQSLSIGQGELGGWTVEITLPFRPPHPIIP